jgi:methionyl-tRNA formyltransferase
LKILAIVGTQLRHQYFLNALIENFNISGIIYYQRSLVQKPKVSNRNFSDEDLQIESKHLDNLQKKEIRYFQDTVSKMDTSRIPSITVSSQKELNSSTTIKWTVEHNGDVMIDYGSGILHNEFLNVLPRYKINLHGGMSPYFKGSATLLWPLYMQQPELIGTTFHLMSKRIDGGEILQHCRPDLSIDDDVSDIGCKAIVKSAEVIVLLLRKLQKDSELLKYEQSGGKLFLEKDYKPACIKIVNILMESGLIEKYLQNKEERDSKYNFIDQLDLF